MTDETKILEYLEQNLSKKRLKHSIGVSKAAEELALNYSSDSEKAKLAGLIHDCAREKSMAELLELTKESGFSFDAMTAEMRELLHGYAAVSICKKEFSIKDEDILSAVAYHTTGKEDMTTFEKIVFLADFIEPSRYFPGVVSLRKLAFENLDEALLYAFDSTIKYIISKKGLIHKNTIDARNCIIRTIKEKALL